MILSVVLSGVVMALETDVCVVGGGSGGVSAALAAARAGARVVVVERLHQLGGTSTSGYVSSWEPGPGDSHAREFYDRLCRIGGAGITSDQNPGRKLGPFGLWLITPQVRYEETLHRGATPYGQCHGVVFDPAKMSRVMAELLAETGRCQVMLNARFVSAEHDGRRVAAIKTDDGTRIQAKVFIDATGNVDLCRAVGCETMLDDALNAISLCYRIRKTEKAVTPPSPEQKVSNFTHAAHVTALPGTTDLLVNPLGTIPGAALIEKGYDAAYAACRPIVQAHWQWLHTFPQFAGYEFVECAPLLGIRESYRVVGEYVLTQDDLAGEKHPDDIAFADHPMDVHGSGRASKLTQVNAAYGIPYRCLVPKGKDNLLVACRGASFSHITASSCRLSRTMIAIGHAAGLAAAQIVKTGKVDVTAIQKQLQPTLTLSRTNNFLVVHGPHGEIRINYLEAYCRAGSTDADWVKHTVIPHKTELISLSDDRKVMKLRDTLEDGVTVEHMITAKDDEVDFRLVARNPGTKRSEAHWAQACPRLGDFTGFAGTNLNDYLPKCFIFLNGKLYRMPTPQWATQARYTPGQTWCPAHVPRTDVNPRPLSPLVPSNGLIGCFSADEKAIWATAWEPYQELFQGVARCLHADFRLGGLEPGATKQIRGKIYLVPADVDALLKRYAADFPEQVRATGGGRSGGGSGSGLP